MVKARKIIVTFIVAILCNGFVYGRNSITGHVVAEDGKGIEFVSVRFLASDSTFVGGGPQIRMADSLLLQIKMVFFSQ